MPPLAQRSRETSGLQEMVNYAADRLALLRLQNLRESLADVEEILHSLKSELEVRRQDGRSVRLTEQLVWEAEQERARLLGQIAAAVDVPGIYRERRRRSDSEESFERAADPRTRVTQHFSRSRRSVEDFTREDHSPVRYRDEDLEDDTPYYYSRPAESAESRFELSSGGKTVRESKPARSSETPSWMSVRVERKTRTHQPAAELRLGDLPARPQVSRPKAPPFSLDRGDPPARKSPAPRAKSEGLSWLSRATEKPAARARVFEPQDFTAEDLPAIPEDDELLLQDDAIFDLDLSDEDFDPGELDVGDFELDELGVVDYDNLDLDSDEDLLGLDDLDFDLLLDEDEAELVDEELAEPFLDDVELEDDLEPGIAEAETHRADDPDDLLPMEEVAEPHTDFELGELDELDELDLGEIDVEVSEEELDLGELAGIDLDNLDFESLELDDDLELLEPEEEVTEVVIEPPVELEEPIAVEPPAELEEPIAIEPPVELEEPIAIEPPVELEEPIAVEPPVELEEPIAVEPPVELEEPIAVEPPVELEAPIAVEPPVELEEPIAVEPPVELEAPQELSAPADLFEGPDQSVTEPVVEELVTEVVSSGEDLFEGLPAEVQFAGGDDLFASGETVAVLEAAVSSGDDLLGGSGESLELGGDFFADGGGTTTSWLDEPIVESAAPLQSPIEEAPPVTEAPSTSLEAAIEEVAAEEAVAPPPPAAVEAPPAPSFDGGASAQERRRLVRLACSYDTSAYLEGRPVNVKLVDISLGGGKLQGPASNFQRGQLIQVSNPLPEARVNEPVTARIVWIRPSRDEEGRFDIGLQFEESPEVLGKSWVITVLNKIGMQSKVFNQRKYTRAAANLPIEIDLKTKERTPGTALDIGLGGALLAVDRPLSPTTRFTLHMGPLGNHDKLELSCEVISSRHDEGGAGWTHSAKFVEISTTQTKLLGKYVVDLLKTGGSV